MRTLRRVIVCVVLCAMGCSSVPKSDNGGDAGNDDGCEALKVGIAMVCASSCGGGVGPDASTPDPGHDAGGPSDPIFFDAGSNAPPPPDFGRPIADVGQPDFGPPIDFGTPPDMGVVGHDGGGPPADAGFEYADACELTLNDDGTISELHGDNEEGGTWSCSDGVVRVDNTERGSQSYVLGSDGCLQGPDYNYN